MDNWLIATLFAIVFLGFMVNAVLDNLRDNKIERIEKAITRLGGDAPQDKIDSRL